MAVLRNFINNKQLRYLIGIKFLPISLYQGMPEEK
ncbi:hypothetical protein BVRB_6g132440 [Beta vulgaris subsp. vulgaris]|nr:hypothetical protein BVRB_6g132440 [Beta vulgaris subsp. vulgaris]